MSKESKVWSVITVVCLSLLIILVAQENGFSLKSILSSDESNTPVVNSEDETNTTLNNTSDEMHPLGNQCLATHDVAMHFHAYLTIMIDGDESSIPQNTGIDTSTCSEAMHMTHTHDTSGKIHIEGNTLEEVPLEVFFDVWGEHYDETGIFQYRNGTTMMTVDGNISTEYQNLILADGQNIVITYSSNQGA